MVSLFKQLFWKIFVGIDTMLKFPSLKKGEIAIQAGFDMSAPVTSDLFELCRKVGRKGRVIAIDPDPENHRIAGAIAVRKKLPIVFIQQALYNMQGTTQLLMGEQSSWNQLSDVPPDHSVPLTEKTVEVKTDTLDNLLAALQLDPQQISHVNLTINGAEYPALQGMETLLTVSENLSLTIIAGRNDESGMINGSPDYIVLSNILHSHGFETRFKMIDELFWWGFIVNRLMKRRKITAVNNYGILMAAKGNKKLKWYQSWS